MTDLSSLIHRLETAEPGSRELDAHIRLALLVNDENAYVMQSPFNGEWLIYSGEHNGRPKLYENYDRSISALWRGEYTSSIDAAVALADKALKVYRLDICMDPSGVSAKVVWWPKGLVECDIQIRTEGMGATPAASIIIAVLKAYPERRP